MECQSQSTDLNPIEHLWDHLKREVRKYSPTNIAELKEIVLKFWSGISPELYRKLVYSIPKHIEAILRSSGRITFLIKSNF